MLVWEFQKRIEGVNKRNIDEWKKFRWLGSLIIAPHSKKRITPNRLLPLPDDKVQSTNLSQEQIDDILEKATQRYKKRTIN